MTVTTATPVSAHLRPQARVRTNDAKHGVFLAEPHPGRAIVVLDGDARRVTRLMRSLTPTGAMARPSAAGAFVLEQALTPDKVQTSFWQPAHWNAHLDFLRLFDDLVIQAHRHAEDPDTAPRHLARFQEGLEGESSRQVWDRLSAQGQSFYRQLWKRAAGSIA